MAVVCPRWESCVSGAVTPALIELVPARLRLGLRAKNYTARQQESTIPLLTLQSTAALWDASWPHRDDLIPHHSECNCIVR